MPKNFMDYITIIAGFFTIVAAIATIFGVCLAFKVHGDWRKSLKYSKIIDVDTTINCIKKELESALRAFWLYRSSEIGGDVNRDFLDEHNRSLKNMNDLIVKYGIQGQELIRMGQVGFSESMCSPVDLSLLAFGVHKNTMERSHNIDELNEYFWESVVTKNDKLFERMNRYLDDIKK